MITESVPFAHWQKSMYRVFLLLLCFVLGLAGLILAARPVLAEETAETAPLARTLEPVVLTASQVSNFRNLPVDELFLYRYDGAQWRQIPIQIDIISADGTYTSREGGLLSRNDEIVFMAKDTGVRIASEQAILQALPISEGWYEIGIRDPLDAGRAGWVYLVHSTQLTRTATERYVNFDSGFHRVETESYRLGLGVTHIGIDNLRLGGSNVNILDRTKISIHCPFPTCPITDNIIRPVADNLVKNGPVRLLLRGGDIKAYAHTLEWSWHYRFAPYPVRFSFDFLPSVVGSTLYNENVPQGVTVDGIPEPMPEEPASRWWQLATPNGTLIHVLDTSEIQGTLKNYYVDDATAIDPKDSGDFYHYGDVGTIIENPVPFTHRYTLYAIPDQRPNIGAAYAAFEANPLQTEILFIGTSFSQPDLYLPVVMNWLPQTAEVDFYDPPALGDFDPNRLGDVLRHELVEIYTAQDVAQFSGIASSPHGAEVYRVLYLSQAPAGELRAVSGLLMVPTGAQPDGGFPLIVQGHLRPDQGDACAPSKNAFTSLGFLSWIAQGYMVMLTDYVGLGTPGIRPTLVGETEAWNLLDAARAAQRFETAGKRPAGSQVFLLGQSLGSHAAIFAHQEWRSYAPEINVVGTVLFSPVTEMRDLLSNLLRIQGQVGPLVLTMYAYGEYYGMPPVTSWLQPAFAAALPRQAADQCIVGFSLWTGNSPDRVFQPDWLRAVRQNQWDRLEPWTALLDMNTPGEFASDRPVLILAGENDNLNPPNASNQLAERLCSHGTPTEYVVYPTANHFTTITVGRPKANEWMAERLQGHPLTAGCPTAAAAP
jgi:pimeloyl-ACP methyl ester carboxylesterase